MEQDIFSWKGWDEIDDYCLYFYDCIFNQKVGQFNKGDKVDGIDIDYQNGEMHIYPDNAVEDKITIKIKLVVDEA